MKSVLSYIGLEENTQQKVVYLAIYAAWGIIFPYFPVFFESLGMSKSRIGILSMIPQMCSFVAAPVFSIISDTFDIHWEMMVALIFASVAFTVPMIFIHSFGLMILIVLLGSTFRAPIGPLLDSLTINELPDKSLYGNIRLWGAVSYGILSFVGGAITSDHTEESYHNLLFLHGFCLLIGGLVIVAMIYRMTIAKRERMIMSLVMQIEAVKQDAASNPIQHGINRDDESYEEATSSKAMLGRNGVKGLSELEMISFESAKESARYGKVGTTSTHNDSANSGTHGPGGGSGENGEQLPVIEALLLVLKRHPSVFVFAMIVFLSGFGSGVIEAFLFVRMKQLGSSGLTMGISRFLTCAAEVPMFQIAGIMHKKYGTWPMLALTQLAFVMRFTYYSFLTNPWAVLPCELLHGLTFATTWSVSCTYANMISPPECHSSMQALLEGLHWGLGSGMGALIGGFAYDRFGAVWLFEASAILSLGSMVLAMGAWYVNGPETNTESDNRSVSGSSHDDSHGLLSKTTVVGGKKVYSSVKEDEEGEYEEIYFDRSMHGSSHSGGSNSGKNSFDGDSGKSI